MLHKIVHKVIRKKQPEEHENLERWMVSYADFVTLLFAFFVVMYAISVINEGKFKVAAESIMSSFKDSLINSPLPEAASKNMVIEKVAVKPEVRPTLTDTPALTEQEKRDARELLRRQAASKKIASDLLKAMEPLKKQGQVQVNETDRGIAVDISASSLFDLGSATLRPESIPAMQEVAKVLSQNTRQIEIEGHTDNLAINSLFFPSNWELSAARAASVIRLFGDNGVTPTRMVLVGYADIHPIASNDTEEGRARNRRVTIMILKEDRDLVTASNRSAARLPPPLAPAQPR